jgi:hypothetical protein
MQLTVNSAKALVGFDPSTYQLGLFQHIADQMMTFFERKPMESVVVKAVAGSGKTTSALAANKIIKKIIEQNRAKMRRPLDVMFLAFGKPIQLELERKLAGTGTSAKTLNGLGHGVLAGFVRQVCNVTRLTLDTSKTFKLMKNLMTEADRRKLGGDIKFLVGKCKAMGVAPIIENEKDPNYGLFFGLNDQYATSTVASTRP